ncbi:nudix hydrolase 2-like protein [Carex littledalei]|uniref:Nudix hydrolase 2-like protein n=1 Tax=Carex littledalei TaxID=544730 RepID=A0A833QZ99_9POAL|nr:nudix hydrolase 2-like protein [Carex littledalei]
MLSSRAAFFSSFQTGIALRTARNRIFLRPARLTFRSDPSFRHSISGDFKVRHTRKLISTRTMSNMANPSSVAGSTLMEQGQDVELLTFVNDDYGGVIVEMKAPMDPTAFASSLRASVSHWRKQGIKGVWIKMPINLANLIQPAVEQGFWYHHAEPNYLMLAYWIPDTKHTLPLNASHRVGVGAFVINNKKEVLVVQEKIGKMKGPGIWKFVTGVVDPGEYIHDGAIREVKEETGVDTEFLEVLAFRQSHMTFFDKSDIFFICMLRPLSSDIQIQESEIEAAQWMPIEEFASQPFVKKHELLKYMVDISLAKIGMGYTGFSPVNISSAFTDRLSYIYVNSGALNRNDRDGSGSSSL